VYLDCDRSAWGFHDFLICLISSWFFFFFFNQENTTCEYPAFHGLFNKTPVGYCYTMVWGVQLISPSTHHWDQIWNDQTNWYCTTDCTRHGVSSVLFVCKQMLGHCLLIPFTVWLALAYKASYLLTLPSQGPALMIRAFGVYCFDQ